MSAPASRQVGVLMLVALVSMAIAAPHLVSHHPAEQFSDFVFAPPMRPHVVDDDGRWRAPFVYPVRLESRIDRRYVEDRTRVTPLRWFQHGALLSTDDRLWFPLGTDALGRDVAARLASGARWSLGVSFTATAGALMLGALIGALAGLYGGMFDDLLMRMSDFVMALPAIYVVLALRAALPLVLSPSQVFACMAGVLILAGWPLAARGVRAVVATERTKEYAEAARALGMGRTRLLLRHLLPAARGFLAAQAMLLLPAFIVSEATLSFVGLGFPGTSPSWGVMLQDAAGGRILADAPWLIAPAAAIACTVLAINLVGAHTTVERTRGGVFS